MGVDCGILVMGDDDYLDGDLVVCIFVVFWKWEESDVFLLGK